MITQAAKKLGLMNSEVEFTLAMSDAAKMEHPRKLRRLFVTILVFGTPKVSNIHQFCEVFCLRIRSISGTSSRVRCTIPTLCMILTVLALLLSSISNGQSIERK